jgi:hypothetical protein
MRLRHDAGEGALLSSTGIENISMVNIRKLKVKMLFSYMSMNKTSIFCDFLCYYIN